MIRYLALFLLILVSLPIYSENTPTISSLAAQNFWQLNRALVFYQAAAQVPWPYIPDTPRVLKLRMQSNTVILLRQRLRASGDLDAIHDNDSRIYDRALAQAVKIFQARHGLKIDGNVGEDTRLALNIPASERVKQIAINLKRWAELSTQLGDRFIMVNIPDFHMYLIENNKKILSLRAIVGKRDLQTPTITSKISRIVFNPYWNIPNKIAKNDIAPKMLEDSSYLSRLHIRVLRNEEEDASEINASRIDWQVAAENGLAYHLRQDPGPENALGLIKFEFQNEHDVYMHDTSAKELFNQEIRDYSHGCIRLENPFALAEYLLQDDPNWTNERIQTILDRGRTQYVKVPRPIPIFVTYLTAWVDDEGRVNFRDDIYEWDEKIFSLARQNSEASIYNAN